MTFTSAVALSPACVTKSRVLPEASGVSVPAFHWARLAFSKITFASVVTSLVKPRSSVSVTITRWLVESG